MSKPVRQQQKPRRGPDAEERQRAERIVPPSPLAPPGSTEKPGSAGIAQEDAQEKPAQHKHPSKARLTRYECISLFCAAVAAVSTFGYFIVTVYQWRAISETNAISTRNVDIAREAIRLDQRPWVTFSFENPLNAGSPTGKATPFPPYVRALSLRNMGRTPAVNLVFEYGLYKGNGETLPLVTFQKDVNRSQIVVFPGNEYQTLPGTIAEITDKDAEDAFAGRLRLYLAGCYSYGDALGRTRHWQTFCAFWDPDRNYYMACEGNNESDATKPGPSPCD